MGTIPPNAVVRRRLLVVLIACAVAVSAVTQLAPAAAATPRPQGLAAASRTCSGFAALTKWTTTNAAFDTVTTCSATFTTSGTLYLTASATMRPDANAPDSGATMEFGLAAAGSAPVAQSQRLVAVHTDSVNGSDMQLTTQAAFDIGPGTQSFVLVGRRLSGTAVPVAKYAQMTGLFVPAAAAASNCISPTAGVVNVVDTDALTIAECSVTVPSHGTIQMLASSGLDTPPGNSAILHLTIDGVDTPIQAMSWGGLSTISALSFGAQAAVGESAGTHVIRLQAFPGENNHAALRQPSISALFVADTSDDVQCSKTKTTPSTYAADPYIAAGAACSVLVPRHAVLQATATVGAFWGGLPGAPEFQLKLDGVFYNANDTDRIVDIYNIQRQTAVVQFSAPVETGNHTVELFVRRNSGSDKIAFDSVSLVVRGIVDAEVIDPPDTTPPSTTIPDGGTVVDYVPVVPDRILETRPAGQVGYSGGKPAPGQVVELKVTSVGASQVPDSAAAVVLNVTGTNADAPGFVTVWPCGSPQPTASNLNLVPGVTSPNLVVAKIGAGGKVCLFTQSSADLVADVNGYMPAGSRYVPVVPERVLETRPAGQTGYSGPKPSADSTLALQVTGVGATQVPADAKAVVLNVTATGAAAAGFVTVWPCGADRPTASNLNLAAGGTSPNLVIAKVGENGKVCIYTQSSLDVVADINGYLPAGASYTPVVPERLLETRPAGQTGYSGAKPGADSTIELAVIGVGATQVPPGTSAVVLNVTGVSPESDGFVTVWPCGSPRPTASNLNLAAGGIVPNLVMTKVGTAGKVCIYTQASAHIVADINGYWP
jgi:hypothetical protein